MNLKLLVLLFFSLLGAQQALAFPEMIRYGYVNCGSCHVSQTGGGVLTEYGREIVREKLSMFKSSDEHSKEPLFGYGVLEATPFQKTIQAGGDVRTVYYYKNDANEKVGKTIFMQGDLEAATTFNKKLTLDGTLGVEQPIPGKPIDFIARRHYAHYALTDVFNIRVGKYVPAYGVATADHISLTRDPLQLGDNFESYNVEANFLNEEWGVFVTGILGRYDDKQAKQDRGFATQVSYAPNERMRLGTNLWYGERPAQRRTMVGGFALIGITNRLSFQSEVDFQMVKPIQGAGNLNANGVATTQKFSFECIEGLWAFLQQEYGKSDFFKVPTQSESYGVGVQIFPRAHFEFNLSYEKVRRGGPSTDFYEYAWLMSHFYL